MLNFVIFSILVMLLSLHSFGYHVDVVPRRVVDHDTGHFNNYSYCGGDWFPSENNQSLVYGAGFTRSCDPNRLVYILSYKDAGRLEVYDSGEPSHIEAKYTLGSSNPELDGMTWKGEGNLRRSRHHGKYDIVLSGYGRAIELLKNRKDDRRVVHVEVTANRDRVLRFLPLRVYFQ